MCPFVVRVPYRLSLADFLGNLITSILPRASTQHTVRFGSSADLPTLSAPTPFNHLFRQMAGLSLFRLHITLYASKGILTFSSIGLAFRLILRTRLTLIRLALIRNPQSSGEGISRPLYRYLYLHLLFQTLQRTLRSSFNADWNAPLPILKEFHSFGSMLIPDYYPCTAARLVSCYALFR